MRTAAASATAGPARTKTEIPIELLMPKLGPKNNRPQLPALTGLRALAALWVVLLHYKANLTSLFPTSVVMLPMIDKGFFAVDLFFVLSGFILAYTYFNQYRGGLDDYASFLWHRIARIYPVHIFILAVLLVLLVGARAIHADISDSRYGLASFAYNVFLIHSWGLLDWDTWNQPSWSLSAEWFAYVFIFPLAWIVLRRVSRSVHALGLMLLSIAAYFVWNLTPAAPSLARFIVRVTCEFFAGSCVYVLFRLNPFKKTHVFALLGFGVGFVGACFVRSDNQLLTPVMILSFAAVVFGLGSGGPLSSALGSRLMIYAGEVSYSLYMVHTVMQKVFKLLLPATRFVHSSLGVRLEVIAAYLISIGGASILTYELVEKPARKKLRDIRRAHRFSVDSGATAARA